LTKKDDLQKLNGSVFARQCLNYKLFFLEGLMDGVQFVARSVNTVFDLLQTFPTLERSGENGDEWRLPLFTLHEVSLNFGALQQFRVKFASVLFRGKRKGAAQNWTDDMFIRDSSNL
jgi:hypothetical protein